MPRLPGPGDKREQLDLRELEDFEAVFPGAFKGKDVGDHTEEEIEHAFQNFFSNLEEVCGLGLSQTVCWQIVEACRFFVARQYTKIPKNSTDIEIGSKQVKKRVEHIKKIVGKFRDELRSEIDRLRDLTEYDMGIMPGEGALPPRSADLKDLFTLFLVAFEGKPQTSGHMTVNQMVAKLGAVENRLNRYLDDFNKSVESSNTVFRDFIFHLADAFEAASGNLYPNDKGQKKTAREAFKAMRNTLLSAMPPDFYLRLSEDTIDQMVRTTLRNRENGGKPSALSLAQKGMQSRS